MLSYTEERRLVWIGSFLGAAILLALLTPRLLPGGEQAPDVNPEPVRVEADTKF